MDAFELQAKPLSRIVGKKQERTHPADVPLGNAHTFYFSSAFAKGSTLLKSLPNPEHSLPRTILPDRPLFYSPETGNGISFEALYNTSLRVAAALSALDLGAAPPSIPGLGGDIGAKQHTILLHMPNSIAFPVLVFAGLAGRFVSLRERALVVPLAVD